MSARALTPKKAQVARSAAKVRMIPFFDHKGFIYQHTVQSHTGIAACYLTVLQTMTKRYQKKLPQKRIEDLPLHYDNVCPHKSRESRLTSSAKKEYYFRVVVQRPDFCLPLWAISKNKKCIETSLDVYSRMKNLQRQRPFSVGFETPLD